VRVAPTRAAAAALFIATIGVAALGIQQSHRGQRTGSERSFVAAQQVMEAASSATVKVLTYSHDSVEKDVSDAMEVTTGEFRDEYSRFTSAQLIPRAREKQVSVEATTLGTGIQSLTSSRATVLIFINQTTTSAANPAPQQSSASAVVGMDNVNGTWKIATFDKL
jgi:Mce-associated membrane protein